MQLCSTRSNGDEECCSVFFVPFAVGLLMSSVFSHLRLSGSSVAMMVQTIWDE